METPALLTHVSMRPKRSSAVSATRRTSSCRPTSAATWTASPPCEFISSTSRRRASSARAATTSFAPRRAASRAVTSPMPLDAPVITRTCSPNFLSLTSIPNPPRCAFEKFKPDEKQTRGPGVGGPLRRTPLTPSRERAVLDHQAAILHDLYPGARELFGHAVVAYAGL